MITVRQLANIANQYNEIVKRVSNGMLDPTTVEHMLDSILEDGAIAPARNLPTWWRTPEQQLARAHLLWPNAVLPEFPMVFTPQANSGVPLLHVPDSFSNLWGNVVAPVGYTKFLKQSFMFDDEHIRLAPNKTEFTEPVWLIFDPEHGKGEAFDSFWGQEDIAAGEVFSALIQFPDWSLSWFNGASAPNLTGYQIKRGNSWSNIPYLNRCDSSHQLELDVSHANDDTSSWSNPSVTVLC